MIGIYKIENLINHKCYIGQSTNIEKRWKNEISAAYNKNDDSYEYPLSRAIRKYGIDNFSFEVIETCQNEELNDKEIYWISYYNSYNNGYNQTIGGNNVSISKLTQEQVDEIRELLINSTIPQVEIAKQYNVSRDMIYGINTGRNWINSKYNYPLRKQDMKKINYCIDCGKEIGNKATRCSICYNKSIRKVDKPSKEELKQLLLDNNGNFTQVGRLFGVNDNSVRKWCKSYDLPFHSSDYKKPKEIKEKKEFNSKINFPVKQYDLNNNYLQEFQSYAEAARWLYQNKKTTSLGGGVRSHIGEVCDGKRKTAYGYIWRRREVSISPSS